MSDLTDILRKSEFIKIYTGMESSGPQKGIIRIEDASDRLFWKKIVNAVCPGQYDIKPFSRPGSEGKRKLEHEYDHLHKDYLVAVDSDYDYLCPERNNYSAKLNKNKFILHTFCYSRESFVHTPEVIEDLTDSIHFHIKTYSQIQMALCRFSACVYEALLLFSWLHNRDQNRFKESDFNMCFHLPAGLLLLDEDLNVNEAAFEQLNSSVKNYTDTYNKYVEDTESFNQHVKYLNHRGINTDSALFFINGHYLLDGIFKPVLELLIRKSRRNDNEWVELNYPDNEKRGRKNQIRNHYEQNCNASQLIYRCESYITSYFWTKITCKLAKIVHGE